jgi:lysophospholipase L1-like esterase
MRMFPVKTFLAVFVTTVLVLLAPMVPALSWMRPPGLDTLARIWKAPLPEGEVIKPATEPHTKPPETGKPAETAVHPGKPSETAPDDPDRPIRVPSDLPDVSSPVAIVDPGGAMRAFYEALQRTETKQGTTRVLHYGDSPVTADSITADARSLFQRQFGDAGHGFILISKPWNWYQHRGMDVKGSGWRTEALSQTPRAKDNLHGLGGVNFQGSAGASSRIRLADGTHTRVEVLYLRQPGGGEFRVEAQGQTVLTAQTEGSEKTSGFASGELPPGTTEIKLAVTRGTVRIFGFSFEKQHSGVVYSSLGLNGASTQSLLRYLDTGHWTEQIRRQNPDLIVLNYGTNESVFPKYVETLYPGELRQVLHRMKEAAPNASILVMSPMDRGERAASGAIVTPPVMAKIVEVQRQAAAETGCAFFNTFEAMGGPGTMAKWYAARPRLVNADYIHPLPGGAAIVGGLLNDAVLQGYRQWKVASK